MTEVVLIRHGATAWNRLVPYRIQGRASDHTLDELGREQAERASRALSDLLIAAIFTSPLRRALETARIVGRPHALVPAAVPELIEGDVGRWEGLTWPEVEARDPEEYGRFIANPGTVRYPEGESFLDVQARVAPAIAALATAHDGRRIAVVTHNIVNRAYLAGVLGLPIDSARGLRQANGGISVVDYQGGTPVLKTLNSCFHLEGIETV